MSRRIKKWTEEEKEYLKSIVFGRSHDEILKLMNEKFEYEFTKEQIKGVYESLIPQMRESFTPIKNELPELENIIYNVCEEDGDVMCTVKIDF